MKHISIPESHSIDINCDLGEGCCPSDEKLDDNLMSYISSCNIACGGHVGNEQSINNTINNAIKHQLKIGAHPSYPDKQNFGRISLSIDIQDLKKSLKQQIDRFQNIIQEKQTQFHHIKFHGALYNDIEANSSLAFELAKFCKTTYPSIKLLGLANGNLAQSCQKLNIEFIAEGFMDRVYLSNGKLSSRKQLGSVLSDPQQVIKQMLALANQKTFMTIDNKPITLKVDSICLHGDNLNALTIAKQIQLALKEASIQIL